MQKHNIRPDLLEHRPEDLPLGLGEQRFSAEAGDISIRLPGVQLSRINDLLPLGQQESPTELVVLSAFTGDPQQLLDDLWRRQIDLPEVGLVETLSGSVDRKVSAMRKYITAQGTGQSITARSAKSADRCSTCLKRNSGHSVGSAFVRLREELRYAVFFR